MALTQISTKGIKDGTITGSDLATNVDLVDNQKLRFGTGNDLQIFHDANDSNIVNNTGSLRLQNDTFIVLEKLNGDNMLRCDGGGAVNLYHNNSKKFETASYGVSTDGLMNFNGTGDKILIGDNGKAVFGGGLDLQIYHDGTDNLLATSGTVLAVHRGTTNAGNPVFEVRSNHGATNQIKFQVDGDGDVLIPTDTGKLQLGVSQDLQLYHDGSHSYITNATNDLRILANEVIFNNANNSENKAKFINNGAVELYHDNTKRFETHSGGVNLLGSGTDAIQMTGDVWFNNNEHAGADVYFNSGDKKLLWEDNVKAVFGGGGDLQIYHDGSASRILNNTGYLTIRSNQFALQNYAGDHDYITVPTAEQSVRLHYDNGLKAFTHSSGWRVNGDCFPNGDGNSAMRLGQPNERWHTVFAITGTINTSDEREKTNINATSLGLDFINKLKPVTYNWKDESRSKKLHYGLVVQDIIKVLEEENIELNDFGAINDEGKFYGLNYSEFISPLIKAVQELSAEVAALKAS